MNGCPHPFSFALPVPPSRATLWHFPLLSFFSFLTAPASPPLPLCPLALTSSPLLLSIRGSSLSLLTERFRRRFFSGLVAVCRLSLYRILSSTGAPYEAHIPLRSPRERINECFTLSPEAGPFAFARERARILFCYYPLFSTHSVFHDPFLSSLVLSSEPIPLPCIFQSYLNAFTSRAIPNLVWASHSFLLSPFSFLISFLLLFFFL